eukprot:6016889-Prymnesium_polylepis.1
MIFVRSSPPRGRRWGRTRLEVARSPRRAPLPGRSSRSRRAGALDEISSSATSASSSINPASP